MSIYDVIYTTTHRDVTLTSIVVWGVTLRSQWRNFALKSGGDQWRRQDLVSGGTTIEAPKAPSGVGYGEGCPLPSQLGGLGERCELPQRGQERSPGRYRIFCIF